jgi:hypothetical protein
MTMSGFRTAPREGHLVRAKRIVGFLAKLPDAGIRYRTNRPDMSQFPETHYDWDHTVYEGAEELLADNFPRPLGKVTDTVTWVDANLYHDFLTGRSVTGIIHALNQTPHEWYSRKQNTSETSTYGSEFCAARTATEQIIAMRTNLRYMGIPVGKSYMFGDNKSVVESASIPHSKLNKRHTALSFHRVRESIAAGILRFFHVPGAENPSDVLSKHWGFYQVWPVLKPLLFWRGNTADANNTSDDDGNN